MPQPVTNSGGTSSIRTSSKLEKLGLADKIVRETNNGSKNNIEPTYRVTKAFSRKEMQDLHQKREELEDESRKVNANLELIKLTSFKTSTQKYFSDNELNKNTIRNLKK